MFRNSLFVLIFTVFSLSSVSVAQAYVKGIYVTSSTANHTRTMNYLVKQSKAAGINTFVVDVYGRSKRYAQNVRMFQRHGIRYVARVVVFPHGGTQAQVANKKIWENRWRRAQYAISLGAKEIQLDYIRFKASNYSSKQNAYKINKVIKFFKDRLRGTGVKLQIDIFGVAAHRPSKTIGQNIPLFAENIDAVNPMVYPSHYEPYRYHAVRPYKTVLDSVSALKRQLRHHPRVKVYAYIELYNYRYPMSRANKVKYILAQMQAAKNGGANGWYAWSARNKYSLLFSILKKYDR